MIPKSQQILVGVTLLLLIFNIIVPIVGETLGINILSFSSTLIRSTHGIFIVVFIIFTYRQIKRKGF